jgi:hypothetical protein
LDWPECLFPLCGLPSHYFNLVGFELTSEFLLESRKTNPEKRIPKIGIPKTRNPENLNPENLNPENSESRKSESRKISIHAQWDVRDGTRSVISKEPVGVLRWLSGLCTLFPSSSRCVLLCSVPLPTNFWGVKLLQRKQVRDKIYFFQKTNR